LIRVKTIDLSGNLLTDGGLSQLARVLPNAVSISQRTLDEENNRYVAVGE